MDMLREAEAPRGNMPRVASLKQPQATIQINTAPQPAEQAPPQEEKHEEKPPRWFFDKLAEIPTNDWGRIWTIELHRLEPTVPGMPGSKGYLAMFSAPVTLNDIKETYGGGKFQMNLCKNGRWETSHSFPIDGPPKYDLTRERPVNAAANGNGSGTDSKLLDMLQSQIQRLNEQIVALQSKNENDGTNRAIDVVAEGANKVIGMVTSNASQARSTASEMREMIGALKDLNIIGAPAAPQKSLMQEFMELLQSPVLKPYLDRLLGPTDPLGELGKLSGALDLLDKIRPGGGKSDWRAALVEQGIPAARDLITTISERRAADVEIARQARARAEAQERTAHTARELNEQRLRATTSATAPGPAATTTVETSAGVLASAFRVVPMDSSERAQPAVASAEAGPTTANADEFLKGVKLRFVELLASSEDSEFIVDWLEGCRPDMIESIVKYTPQQLTAYFQNDPILAHAVAHPRWAQWLADARAYLTEAEALRTVPGERVQ
jgi:hypothetical protein